MAPWASQRFFYSSSFGLSVEDGSNSNFSRKNANPSGGATRAMCDKQSSHLIQHTLLYLEMEEIQCIERNACSTRFRKEEANRTKANFKNVNIPKRRFI